MNEIVAQELRTFLSKQHPLPARSEIGGKLVFTTVASGHIEHRIAFHIRDALFAVFSYQMIGLSPSRPDNLEFRPEFSMMRTAPDEGDLADLALWLVTVNRA